MNYTVIVVTLCVIILMLVYTQKLIHFLNLINLKFKNSKPQIIEPAYVKRDILLKLAKIEKFLYKQRFTRRLIVEHTDSYTSTNYKRYIFYYYQLIDGIHAFIEAIEIEGKIEFTISFKTFYDSKNICCSTNESKYILNSVPARIYLFEHKKFSEDKLYSQHLKEREILNETIYKKRLLPNELLNYEIEKEQEYIQELVQNGYATYKDYGFKLLPTLKLWNNGVEVNKILKITKSNKSILFKIAISYIFILAMLFTLFFYLTNTKVKDKVIVSNPNIEFIKFQKEVKKLSGLTITLTNDKKYTIEQSMQDIDNYLKNSTIKRYIGKAFRRDMNESGLPCKLPQNLVKMYKWHNGLELLIPNRDFFNFSDFKLTYKSFRNRIKDLNNSNMVFVFASKYDYRGLAFNCKKSGLYEYSINSNINPRKEFYNFNHFLKIVAESYKQGAFYDDIDTINVDIKKFFKIYKTYFSRSDKHRYNLLIKYLKDRASAYKDSTSKLKLALLDEISKTYDAKLVNSVKIYLNDKNSEVVTKAIEALGDIGNKSIVPTLIKYLKSTNIKYKDFALLALAKIVNTQDSGLVEYITPILNENSVLARISAYEVLTRIGDKESLVLTRENFKKEKPAVKLAMIKLFAEIGNKEDAEILKAYLKEVRKMDYSKEIKEPTRGSDPHPKILEYEILKALKAIELRNKN